MAEDFSIVHINQYLSEEEKNRCYLLIQVFTNKFPRYSVVIYKWNKKKRNCLELGKI